MHPKGGARGLSAAHNAVRAARRAAGASGRHRPRTASEQRSCVRGRAAGCGGSRCCAHENGTKHCCWQCWNPRHLLWLVSRTHMHSVHVCYMYCLQACNCCCASPDGLASFRRSCSKHKSGAPTPLCGRPRTRRRRSNDNHHSDGGNMPSLLSALNKPCVHDQYLRSFSGKFCSRILYVETSFCLQAG